MSPTPTKQQHHYSQSRWPKYDLGTQVKITKSDLTKYTYLNFSKSFGVANSVFIPFTGEQTKIQRNAQLRLTHVFKALRIFLDAVDGFCQGDQLGRGGGVRLRAAVDLF